MSYENYYPNGWQSGESGGTPITPEALNHMEKGIKAVYTSFAPAVESADYPGCYYRTVNGVVEWLNPPMVPGVEYRTTERFDGKAVYTRLVNCGIAAHNASITIPGVTRCVRYIGYIGYPHESYPIKPLPAWSGDTIGAGYHAEVTQPINPYADGQFIIKTDSNADSIGGGGYTWFVQAWYTKD